LKNPDIHSTAMTFAEFTEAIRHEYTTPPGRAGFASRLGPLNAVWFHTRMLATLFSVSSKVKDNVLDRYAAAEHGRRVLLLAETAGCRCHISRFRHLEAVDGPAVIVANHISSFETMVLPGMILPFKPFSFVLKSSLMNYPVLGKVLNGLDPIVVARANAREDLKTVLTEGRARLEAGKSVLLFPQHTRSLEVDPVAFNSLGAKLARGTGAPIVPIALRTEFLAKGRLIKDIGPIDPSLDLHFECGPALEVEGNGKEAHRASVDFIIERLKQWRSQ
jgi:1-acyl-sn-glycerol-3-phosphate acyltransferase